MNARPPASGVTVEVVHEAIAHHWPRLRRWLALDQAARFANIAPAAPLSANGRANEEPARIRRAHRPRRGRLARTRISSDQSPGTPGSRTDATTSPQQPEALGSVEVAHEALIRHWPRLRGWLDEDRSSLLLREAISEAAQAWEQSGRDESYLAHRGRRLDEAAALAQHPRFALNAQERAYLDAALALREREEQEREAQRQRELAAQRERAELAEQRGTEQAAAARGLQRRLLVAVGLGLVAVFAALAAFVGFQQAGQERDRAQEQETIARIRALAAEASRESALGQHERGALLARQAFLLSAGFDGSMRGSVDEVLRGSLNSDHFTNVLSGQGVNDIFDIAFSPKASLMAGVGAGGAVRLWNLDRPTTPPVNLPIRNVGSVAFSPDGRALAVARCSAADECVEGEIHVISLDEPESAPIVFVIPEVWVTSVAYSPDGQTLAAGSIDGSVRLWSLGEPRSPPRVFIGSPYTVTSVAFSPDGRTLAAGGCGSSPNMGDCSQGAVRLIAIDRTAADPVDLPADHGPMHSVTFTQDGRWLIAAARRESGVHLWQLANPGAPPTSLAGPPGGVATMALSQDGRTLAVGGCGAAQLYGECIGGEARLFDLANLGAAPIVLTGLGKSVTSVTFSADGAWLATSGCRQWTNRVSECAEFEIRLIRLGRSAASPVTLDRAAERSDLMGFSPIGHIVTQSVDDAKLRQWDPDQPETPVSDLGDRLMFGMASNIAFSPDGQLLAWGSHVGVVFIWGPARSTTDPVVLRDRRRPEVNIIRDLVFGPDGRMLAGLDESHAVLWDVTQPTIAASELPLPANWHGELVELALDEEGTRLTAIGIEDGAIAVMRWDVPTPASGPTALMRLAANGLQVLTLSSDGQLLAASNESGAVVLWDLRQPEPSPVLLAVPPAAPSALAFDPSGALLAVGTADGSVLLLRLDQPDTPAVSLTVSDYPVSRVAFSPDGQRLATDAADAVRLWLVSTDALAEIVCDQVLRNLTLAEWQQYVEPGNTYQRTCPNLPPGEGAPPDPAFSAATPHPSGPS